MPTLHVLLTLMVIVIWGVNFVFVSVALDELSPFLLCTLRFILSSVPAIFFIKRPSAQAFKLVAAYGLVMFALQFSLIFFSMKVGMPPGIASLLMQTQVFFSVFFAVMFLGEQPRVTQIFGALIAFMGIALVALHLDGSGMSLSSFILVLAAAATWGVGNLITKKTHGTHFSTVIVWGSFVAVFPMLILSLLLEGAQSMAFTVTHLSSKGIGALLYIVYVSTLIGYGIWNWLISKYPVSMVVPYTLLIPVIGMASAVLFFGEPLQSWKIMAGLLVLIGLSINVLGPRFLVARVRSEAI